MMNYNINDEKKCLKWLENVRETLYQTESRNLMLRTDCLTTIMNQNIEKLHQKYNFGPIPKKFVVKMDKKQHLSFIHKWNGLKLRGMDKLPQTIDEYERKSINWLNGRRATNYGKTLFPFFIHCVKSHFDELGDIIFKNDSDKSFLYSNIGVYTILSILCSVMLNMGKSGKQASFFCRNSLEKKGPFKLLLQKFVPEHPFIDGFPTSHNDASVYFNNKANKYIQRYIKLSNNNNNNNNNNKMNIDSKQNDYDEDIDLNIDKKKRKIKKESIDQPIKKLKLATPINSTSSNIITPMMSSFYSNSSIKSNTPDTATNINIANVNRINRSINNNNNDNSISVITGNGIKLQGISLSQLNTLKQFTKTNTIKNVNTNTNKHKSHNKNKNNNNINWEKKFKDLERKHFDLTVKYNQVIKERDQLRVHCFKNLISGLPASTQQAFMSNKIDMSMLKTNQPQHNIPNKIDIPILHNNQPQHLPNIPQTIHHNISNIPPQNANNINILGPNALNNPVVVGLPNIPMINTFPLMNLPQ